MGKSVDFFLSFATPNTVYAGMAMALQRQLSSCPRFLFTLRSRSLEERDQLTRQFTALTRNSSHLISYMLILSLSDPGQGDGPSVAIAGLIRFEAESVRLLLTNPQLLFQLFPILAPATLIPVWGTDRLVSRCLLRFGQTLVRWGQPSDYISDALSMREAMDICPEACLTHFFMIHAAVSANRFAAQMPCPLQTQLCRWQSQVLSMFLQQGPQEILFVIDRQGGSGKTFLAHQVASSQSPLEVFRVTAKGEQHNTTKILKGRCNKVIFDYEDGSLPGAFDWALMDGLKRGCLPVCEPTETVYHLLDEPLVQILVFSPVGLEDWQHKLPSSRWQIIDLDDERHIHGLALFAFR